MRPWCDSRGAPYDIAVRNDRGENGVAVHGASVILLKKMVCVVYVVMEEV